MRNHTYLSTFSHILLTIVSYREYSHYRCFVKVVVLLAGADVGCAACFSIRMLPLWLYINFCCLYAVLFNISQLIIVQVCSWQRSGCFGQVVVRFSVYQLVLLGFLWVLGLQVVHDSRSHRFVTLSKGIDKRLNIDTQNIDHLLIVCPWSVGFYFLNYTLWTKHIIGDSDYNNIRVGIVDSLLLKGFVFRKDFLIHAVDRKLNLSQNRIVSVYSLVDVVDWSVWITTLEIYRLIIDLDIYAPTSTS